ncbi:MAG: hypothetical protein EXQ94_00470 [Alphaproteobacteria bacterium]|nr:hypothetical protein [Alphaproteobacteria bacterium]
MALPTPEPGLVIRYAYLWRNEALLGREEGIKDRPCAVVLTVKKDGDRTIVVVAPITHAQPRPEIGALEIPVRVARRLGLDDRHSWIVTHEVNVFTWPGPDLRVVDPKEQEGGIAYGHLPKALADKVIAGVRAHRDARRLRAVDRD